MSTGTTPLDRLWIFLSHWVSPFGIDTLEPSTNSFTKHYALLDSVSQIVLDAQHLPGSSVGLFFDKLADNGSDPSELFVLPYRGFEITIQCCLVLGKPAPGSGMLINLGGANFLLIGWGFQVCATSLSTAATFTGILRFGEKISTNWETGELRTLRVLNGDETRSGISPCRTRNQTMAGYDDSRPYYDR